MFLVYIIYSTTFDKDTYPIESDVNVPTSVILYSVEHERGSYMWLKLGMIGISSNDDEYRTPIFLSINRLLRVISETEYPFKKLHTWFESTRFIVISVVPYS